MRGKSLLRHVFKLILSLAAITACGACALYAFQRWNVSSVISEYTMSGNQILSSAASDSPLPETDAPDFPPTESDAANPSPAEGTADSAAPSEEAEPFRERTVSLMAVGDNLIHMGVVYTGLQSDGTFDFSFLFEGISDFLDSADIKIINQETIFAGNQLGFSGFPKFNSPTEVGDGIASAGFNVVLQATNHSADQGIEGMENCISFWEKHPEVLMTGIHARETADTPRNIPLLTIDDITFAVLNYTYGPNMGTLPASLRGCLDMLCAYDENTGAIDFTTLNPQVTEDIRAADELADVVVVCPHWGTEYSTRPSRYQKDFALEMAEAGADLILGTHPHVVQPVEWIETSNGNRTLCFYSLGNYVSTQKEPVCMLEAMAWVTFDVTEDGVSISKECSGAIPLVCHYRSNPVRIKNIYLLEHYTEELAASHGIRNYGDAPLALSDLLQWRDEILGESVLSASDALTPQNS